MAAKDLGGDVIPALTASGVAHLYDFSTNVIPGQEEHERGYWRDVGTLDAYYWANMDLLGALPSFSLYNPEWPVYSLQLPLPPAKLCYGSDGSAASVDNSLICTGAIVSGGTRRAVDRRAGRAHRVRQRGDRVHPAARASGWPPAPGCTAASSTRTSRSPPGTASGVDDGADPEQFARSDQGIIVVEKDRTLG